MDRKQLFDIVNALYPAHWISQEAGECLAPYVVIKYKPQIPSIGNKLAGWQYVDFMAYVPMASILPLDDMIDEIKTELSKHMEMTGAITPDYVDVDVKAIMRSIEFRIPKQL